MNGRNSIIAALMPLALVWAATALPATDNTATLIADFQLQNGFGELAKRGATADVYNAEYTPIGLLLNQGYEHRSGGGYRATFFVPELDLQSFSFTLDFAPIVWGVKESAPPPRVIRFFQGLGDSIVESPRAKESFNLITLGEGYRWLGFNHGQGHLQVTLNNQRQKFDLTNTVLTPGEWHRLACAFDDHAGTIQIVLDGTPLPPITFPPNVRLDVLEDPKVVAREKEFTFANYSNGESFDGYASALQVFNRAFTREELLDLGSLNRPPLPTPPRVAWPLSALLLALVMALLFWWRYRHSDSRPPDQAG